MFVKESIWCRYAVSYFRFFSLARLDHTDLYDFENCHWVQGFLYLSHIYSKIIVNNF